MKHLKDLLSLMMTRKKSLKVIRVVWKKRGG